MINNAVKLYFTAILELKLKITVNPNSDFCQINHERKFHTAPSVLTNTVLIGIC